jgi:peroxiredoxin/mono/diheme cytochrome c family protein
MSQLVAVSCWISLGLGVLLANPVRGLANEPLPPLTRVELRTLENQRLGWDRLKGQTATVVVFLSFDCPMCRSYFPTLNELATRFGKQGVTVLGLLPNDEDLKTLALQAQKYQLRFPVFPDSDLTIANILKATTTPEAFVFDSNSQLHYRGLIDDAYAKRLVRKPQVSKTYLFDAIESLLAGKPPALASTEPIGCKIPRPQAPVATKEGPTYSRDVAPILQKHCQGCHRPGGAGPFSLLTYKDAQTWAEEMQSFVKSRQMPPWKPVGGLELIGDRRLAVKEIDTLVRWVEAGCPKGDASEAAPARAEACEWPLGQPDVVLEMTDDFVLGPTGRDHYRVIVLPTGLQEDRYLRAVDVRPGNTSVVHHAVNLFDTTGWARRQQANHQVWEAQRRTAEAVDIGPGFPSGMLPGIRLNPADLVARTPAYGPLGGWAPGMMPQSLPAGTGFFLPKNSDFVMQLHYHRTGRIEKDRTKVGLYFAQQPVERPILPVVIPGYFKPTVQTTDPLGYIPAGDANCRGHGTWYVLEDCTIYAVMPHMHLLGKSIKITFTAPGQRTETLIDIPEWDFNWQEVYNLKRPLQVKAGTRFDIEGRFDNSAANPNNPNNPPVDVRFGEQTTDEMLFGFLYATKDNPKSGLPFVLLQGPVRWTR